MNENDLIEILKNQIELLKCKQTECQPNTGANIIQEILELSKQIESLIRGITDIQRKVVTD